MDTGAKTLAQLAEENKNEKKYVTLEVGSKISGYTKDYLERLCRLNKVEYRIWSNGNFVIELESLLKETQALLLSYEGINFVDKNELTDPTPQVVGSILSSALKEIHTTVAPAPKNIPPTVPTFSEKVSTPSAQVSFVGRAVVSDALHPEEKDASRELVKDAAGGEAGVPQTSLAVPKKEESPLHIPVTKLNMDKVRDESAEKIPVETTGVLEHVPIIAVNSPHDDWDSQLLGEHVSETPARHIPIVKASSAEKEIPQQEEVAPPVKSGEDALNPGFIPPSGMKVMVFSGNQEETVAGKLSSAAVPPAAPAVPLPKEASLTVPQPTLPVPALSALPILTHSPELNVPESMKQPAPQPSPFIPAKNGEHRLTTYEMHPLMKSTGFNLVFAAMLFASSFTMLGGKVFENIGDKLNTTSYVAGVGAAGGTIPPPLAPTSTNTAKETVSAILPFSNDIVATSGKKEHSIIIRPVFENGEEGKSYEYIITTTDSASTTPER